MRQSILVCALLLSACGQSSETVTVKDSEGNERSVEVTQNGDTRTVTSGDGLIKAEGKMGGKDARFPAFAPQYPGSEVQGVVDMTAGTSATGGMKQNIITQSTKDTPEAVVAFYKEKAAGSGKRVQEIKSATGPMLIIGGTSMIDMEATVTAMPVPSGGTSVNVTVQEKVPPS
jgi:hypothetical protein